MKTHTVTITKEVPDDIQVEEGKKFELTTGMLIAILTVLLIGGIAGFAKWGVDFFMWAVIVVIVALFLVIAINMGKATKIGLIIAILTLSLGSGWIMLINTITEKIALDNQKGLIIWPLATFLTLSFVAFFFVFVFTYNTKNRTIMVFPTIFTVATCAYSLFSDMGVWITALSIGIVVMFLMLWANSRVRVAEEKAKNESLISGFLFSAAVATTLLIVLTIPLISSIALSGNSWWGLFTSFGGTVSGVWLTFNTHHLFFHTKKQPKQMKSLKEHMNEQALKKQKKK